MPESIGDGDRCRAFATRSTVAAGGGDGLVLDRIVCDIVRGIIERNVLNVRRWEITCEVRTTDGVRTKHAPVDGPLRGRGNSELRRDVAGEVGILPMDRAMPRNSGTVNCQRESAKQQRMKFKKMSYLRPPTISQSIWRLDFQISSYMKIRRYRR